MRRTIKILTGVEIAKVLADLRRKRRSINTRQNLVIFRLATCCGLRVSEIAGLTIANVRLASDRPHIHVPKAIGKGGRARRVPLHWDGSTLADLVAWRAERVEQGAEPGDPFVCCQSKGSEGQPLGIRNLQNRWKAAVRVLGPERVNAADPTERGLSIHCGRHSFCSHALAGGRSLVEVRDAAGHSNVSTTSLYLHGVDDGGTIGTLFDFAQ